MADEQQVETFIRDHFNSVWTLELLLHLKRAGAAMTPAELEAGLRASGSVVESALAVLFAAGFILIDEAESAEGAGPDRTARYAPVSPDLAGLVEAAESLYLQRPGAVRRLIVQSRREGLTAFSDAFRIWKD
jgi:hypothetical protein